MCSRITPLGRRVHTLSRPRQEASKRKLPLELDIFTISSSSRRTEPTAFRETPRFGRESAADVLKEFARETSIHGVRYFSKPGLGVAGRLCWTAAVLVCTIFAYSCISSVLCQFWRNPMIVTVETTNYPLHNVPFPAITICPANKIKRILAENLLLRFLNITVPDDELQVQLGHFLSALAQFQHPFYFRAGGHLEEAANILPVFSRLRISQFMLKMLPTCEEIFQDCFWQGSPVNCCTSFHIQRSEVGFCYAFNSLTSDVTNNCHVSRGDSQNMESGRNRNANRQECVPHFNTASGTTTGLEVFLRKSNEAYGLKHGQRDTRGYRVYVNNPDNFPEAGNSWLVPEGPGHVYTMKVSPSVTVSSPAVKALLPGERQCYFGNERHLDIHPAYTQSSCLIECRLRYIATVCHCMPYFYHTSISTSLAPCGFVGQYYQCATETSNQREAVQECNTTQLKCIADHNLDLRLYSLPTGAGPRRDQDDSSPLNCSGCLPTCDHVHYQLETSYQPDSNTYGSSSGAYIDIYYAHLGAVKYHQQLAFDSMQLLVSCGGIAGLFLGVSLLTLAELVYYFVRLFKTFFSFTSSLQTFPITQHVMSREIQIK